MNPVFECSCERCVSACRRKPGLFMPGEAEVLAANMGLTLKELFETRLAVEWETTTGGERIYALSPAIEGIEPGGKFPEDRRFGTCTFLKDGRCEVHELGKPYDCAMATHAPAIDPTCTVAAWVPHQGQIRELLDGHSRFAWG